MGFFLFFHMAPHKSGVSEWRTCFQQNVDFNLWSKIVPPTYVSICMYLALFIFQFLEQCFKIKRIKGLTALWINDRDLLPIISIFRKVHSARPPALSGCTSYFLYQENCQLLKDRNARSWWHSLFHFLWFYVQIKIG